MDRGRVLNRLLGTVFNVFLIVHVGLDERRRLPRLGHRAGGRDGRDPAADTGVRRDAPRLDHLHVRDAVGQVRAHHVLLLILATALHGASTEGWDRLADLHFLRGIGLPPILDLDRIVWFALFDGVSLLLGIGAIAFIKRRVHLEGHARVAKLLAAIDVSLVAGAIVFAVVGSFWAAVVAFWIVGGLRSVREPIFTAWIDQGLDPSTRATINSMGGQSDAVGQALAGPVVGGIGRVASVPWAISVAGLLRLPVLLLYLRAIRLGTAGTRPPEAIEQELDLGEGAP